jgi:4-amino-4-deoxy-L-arabinose transferase-like glycosyltransferase
MATQVDQLEVKSDTETPVLTTFGGLEAGGKDKAGSGLDVLLAILLAVSILALTLLWFSYDHRFPTQDEANHILSSITFRELLMHSRPWQGQWWYHCWSTNAFYPPFVYFINAIFLLTFGQSRFVEQLSMSCFAGLMVLSIYGLTRLLNGTRLAAGAAALCLAMYPAISELSHTFFLDLPVVSMTAFAVMVFLWWRHGKEPSLWGALLAGVAFGAACLTKQIVAAYLLPVGLYFLVYDLVLKIKQQRTEESRSRGNWLFQTIGVGIITMIIGLPFTLITYQTSRSYIASNMEAFASKGIHLSYLDKLWLYVYQLPSAMSPVLWGLFVIAVLQVSRKSFMSMLPVIVSSLGGLCITLACPGIGTDFRYYLPSLITPAILSGLVLDKLLLSKNRWALPAIIIVMGISVGNYVVNNFAPYPLQVPAQAFKLLRTVYVNNPEPITDWGHQMVIDTIMKIDRDKIVYLNILPNDHALHINAFTLLLKEQNNENIRVSGSRLYTIVGDQVHFNQREALGYHWYLWKTGATGLKFFDKHSENEFRRLVDFVQLGGNYRLVAQQSLPDGTKLMLYRRTI